VASGGLSARSGTGTRLQFTPSLTFIFPLILHRAIGISVIYRIIVLMSESALQTGKQPNPGELLPPMRLCPANLLVTISPDIAVRTIIHGSGVIT